MGAVEDVDFISGIDVDVGYTKSYDYLDQSSTYSEWEVHMRNRLFNDRFIVDVGGSYVADNPVIPEAYFAGDYALEFEIERDVAIEKGLPAWLAYFRGIEPQ